LKLVTISSVSLKKAIDPDWMTAMKKDEHALAELEKRSDSENGGAGELSLQINKVNSDATIDLEASEQCRFGDCRGGTIFKVNERLRLSDGRRVRVSKC